MEWTRVSNTSRTFSPKPKSWERLYMYQWISSICRKDFVVCSALCKTSSRGKFGLQKSCNVLGSFSGNISKCLMIIRVHFLQHILQSRTSRLWSCITPAQFWIKTRKLTNKCFNLDVDATQFPIPLSSICINWNFNSKIVSTFFFTNKS